MSADPAVRSVRVAVALCDRLGELLKGPDKVTARKQNNAMFGIAGNEDEMSLRIGEVQQIYPEIWRHLDDARVAFAARGIDVATFDEIRASEGVALGAAPELARAQHGAGQYGYAETVKTANFNRAGHQRAVQAARALMIATPEIDWQAIAKAEAEDPNIAAFTRSTNTKRYIMFGLLALVIASPFIYVWNSRRREHEKHVATAARFSTELSAEDRASIAKQIADARARYEPAIAAWDPAFTPEALAALEPGAKPCAFTFPAPKPEAAIKFVKYASVDRDYGPAFASYPANTKIDNRLERTQFTLDDLGRGLRTDAVWRERVDRELGGLPGHVLIVVIDKEIAPKAGGGSTFEPGQVVARAFVFGVAERKIICTGAIDVTNTPNLETPANDRQAHETLYRDLEVQLRRGIAANLRAI